MYPEDSLFNDYENPLCGFIARLVCNLSTNSTQNTMAKIALIIYNNDDDFLCANILEDRAQWRDKTKIKINILLNNMCLDN